MKNQTTILLSLMMLVSVSACQGKRKPVDPNNAKKSDNVSKKEATACKGLDISGRWITNGAIIEINKAETGYDQLRTVANKDGAFEGEGVSQIRSSLELADNCILTQSNIMVLKSVDGKNTGAAPNGTVEIYKILNAAEIKSKPLKIAQCKDAACVEVDTAGAVELTRALDIEAAAVDCSKVNLVGNWNRVIEAGAASEAIAITKSATEGKLDAAIVVKNEKKKSTLSQKSILSLDAKSCILSNTLQSSTESVTGSPDKVNNSVAAPIFVKVTAYEDKDGLRRVALNDCADATCTNLDAAKVATYESK